MRSTPALWVDAIAWFPSFPPTDTQVVYKREGVYAAQLIKPRPRTLAEDRGIRCVTLDYDALRGIESDEFRLF